MQPEEKRRQSNPSTPDAGSRNSISVIATAACVLLLMTGANQTQAQSAWAKTPVPPPDQTALKAEPRPPVLEFLASRTNITPQSSTTPTIIAISPPMGALDVDPLVNEIRVTFDQDMESGFSWCTSWTLPDNSSHFPTIREGFDVYWVGKRTCVLPVVLKKGWYYRLAINSTASHQGFRNLDGIPADPTEFDFTTSNFNAAGDWELFQ